MPALRDDPRKPSRAGSAFPRLRKEAFGVELVNPGGREGKREAAGWWGRVFKRDQGMVSPITCEPAWERRGRGQGE